LTRVVRIQLAYRMLIAKDLGLAPWAPFVEDPATVASGFVLRSAESSYARNAAHTGWQAQSARITA
jgi:hypothetical protein